MDFEERKRRLNTATSLFKGVSGRENRLGEEAWIQRWQFAPQSAEDEASQVFQLAASIVSSAYLMPVPVSS